jgi:hypothetical protein
VRENVLENSISSNQSNPDKEDELNELAEDWPDLIG